MPDAADTEREARVLLEITGLCAPEALRDAVEKAADRLMGELLANPAITDPSIMLTLHSGDTRWSTINPLTPEVDPVALAQIDRIPELPPDPESEVQ